MGPNAVWNVRQTTANPNSRLYSLAVDTGSKIDLRDSTPNFSTLTIETLSGTGSTFFVDTDIQADKSDQISIGTGSGTHKVHVQPTGVEPSREAMDTFIVQEKTGDAAFSLANTGGRVEAGVYFYDLATRANTAVATTTEWYLKRAPIPTPPTEPVEPADPVPDPTPPTPEKPVKPAPDPDPVPPTPPTDPVEPTPPAPVEPAPVEPAPHPAPTPPAEPLHPTEPEPTPPTPMHPSPLPDRTEPLTPTAETVLGLSGMAASYSMWYGQLSDLRERLGEIRYGNGKDGFWTRGFIQKHRLNGLGGIDFSQNMYGGSLGYDHLYESGADNKWLLGFRAQMTRADQTVRGHYSGTGDNDSYGFAGYATWQNTDDWYADGVITWDWYDQDLKTKMLDGTPVKGTYKNYGAGLSFETGKMIRFDNNSFIEPQVQLSYYWLKGNSFTMSNGMETKQHHAESLTARAGVVVGKKWTYEDGHFIQPYIKAGVNHEFLGDQKAVVNGTSFTGALSGTRVYYGAGVDWKVSDSVRLYGEFEREEGHHLSQPWSVSAGLRYEF